MLYQPENKLTCNVSVQWETTPLSTHTAHIISTLPSDVVLVNNIKYHKVSDPCSVSRDRMCPWACAEVKSTDSHGHSCTMCDCKGWYENISDFSKFNHISRDNIILDSFMLKPFESNESIVIYP